jgi:hypothetical protein
MQPTTPQTSEIQRLVVYVVTGVLGLAGLMLVLLLKDPRHGRLPGPIPLIAVLAMWGTTVLFYELRWYIRQWIVAALGVTEIGVAIALLQANRATVLAVANALIGITLVAAAYGIHKEQRGPWAAAVSTCGTLALVYTFGASRVAREVGTHLGWAFLPALAMFLPACIMLATSAPGSARYAPFASKPLTARR